MPQINPNLRRFLMTSALALCLPLSSHAQEVSAPAAAVRPATDRADGPAQGRFHHRERGEGERAGLLNPRLIKALDLSQAQRDELKKLADSDREARRTQREALMASRKALRDLVIGEQYSDARAKELAGRIATQDSAQILARAEQAHRMMQVLTPEQRTKLAQLAAARKPGRDGERGRPADKG
ncbi:Spy/CpxP family protein refolding chaperone [Uliginosibacterium paludis]|uniref:Spy/CpxP family protein refolding chaperone n=1 Tax=Uliginosibacterium paludis TaxID=1615952 RepID=A0ABV2CPE2_9RHOO